MKVSSVDAYNCFIESFKLIYQLHLISLEINDHLKQLSKSAEFTWTGKLKFKTFLKIFRTWMVMKCDKKNCKEGQIPHTHHWRKLQNSHLSSKYCQLSSRSSITRAHLSLSHRNENRRQKARAHAIIRLHHYKTACLTAADQWSYPTRGCSCIALSSAGSHR